MIILRHNTFINCCRSCHCTPDALLCEMHTYAGQGSPRSGKRIFCTGDQLYLVVMRHAIPRQGAWLEIVYGHLVHPLSSH